MGLKRTRFPLPRVPRAGMPSFVPFKTTRDALGTATTTSGSTTGRVTWLV